MRRVGDFMEDLGFNADAPEGAQKAFIKNLIRAAYGADVKNLADYQSTPASPQKKNLERALKNVSDQPAEQMSFDFSLASRSS